MATRDELWGESDTVKLRPPEDPLSYLVEEKRAPTAEGTPPPLSCPQRRPQWTPPEKTGSGGDPSPPPEAPAR